MRLVRCDGYVDLGVILKCNLKLISEHRLSTSDLFDLIELFNFLWILNECEFNC
jgi:hypothetical protein